MSFKKFFTLLVAVLAVGLSACDDDGQFGFFPIQNSGPNLNPGPHALTSCIALYQVHVDHVNQSAAIDVLSAHHWVLEESASVALVRTATGGTSSCPTSAAPQSVDAGGILVGGRWAGGAQPTDPTLVNYLSGITPFGYLTLDLDRLVLDRNVSTFNEWNFSNHLRPIDPIAVADCTVTLLPRNIVVSQDPVGGHWQTDGELVVKIDHDTNVGACTSVMDNIPPGPFAQYHPATSLADYFSQQLWLIGEDMF